MSVPSDPRYDRRKIEVNGQQMAYVEAGDGDGDPIVFLHGNPTSSYLWRNVMPHLERQGRVIAPDLIGMGDSDKLADSGPDSYRFVEHRDYLFGFLDQLGVTENVTLVIHDWGSALGFHWAHKHPERVTGIAYMEAIVKPVTWAEWPEMARDIFRSLRSDEGEDMVLENNLFVEAVLPGSVIDGPTEEAMEQYRRPYLEAGEGRRPTLTWPREIPLDGEPADVVEIVQSYSDWLPTSSIPKLFINADPGAILTGPTRDFVRTFENQDETTVPGIHFIQEDSPDLIGRAISDWLAKIRSA
jgi:haloalkane dehalogenase